MNLTNTVINRKSYNMVIGIDPGINTGFAWSLNAKGKPITKYFTGYDFQAKTFSIHSALFMVKEWAKTFHILVRIEDPSTWIPFAGSDGVKNNAKRQGAGSIKRDLSIWKEFLEDYHIDYELISLRAVQKKVSASAFKKITGYEERTSNHARDAGMLIFNYFS